jgi:predicted ATP-dependent endonuclease of OLD family
VNCFAKLVIKNFRSFDENGVSIDFRNNESVLVLLGPNGSGKSNALHALAIALGVYPFSRFGSILEARRLGLEAHASEVNAFATLPARSATTYRRYHYTWALDRFHEHDWRSSELSAERRCLAQNVAEVAIER